MFCKAVWKHGGYKDRKPCCCVFAFTNMGEALGAVIKIHVHSIYISFTGAAGTKCQRLGALSNRYLFHHGSRVGSLRWPCNVLFLFVCFVLAFYDLSTWL